MSVGHVRDHCRNVSEPIEILFEADLGGPKEPRIRWGQERTNPFAAARGDKATEQPFAKLLWTVVYLDTQPGKNGYAA